MASLYKKPIFVNDPRTGQRTKAKSKKWWGRFRDHLGVEHRMPLARNRAAAQAMLNEHVLKAERRAAGRVDPVEEQGKRPLKDHIDDFAQNLKDKGNSTQPSSRSNPGFGRFRPPVNGTSFRTFRPTMSSAT